MVDLVHVLVGARVRVEVFEHRPRLVLSMRSPALFRAQAGGLAAHVA